MSWFTFLKRDLYKEMTRASDAWWNTIYRADDFYDRVDLPLTVHVCGSEDVIEAKASEISGSKIDYQGTSGLALYDRQGKPHLFVLATEIGFVQREINYFTAGHELSHLIDFANERHGNRTVDYPNPDEGRT